MRRGILTFILVVLAIVAVPPILAGVFGWGPDRGALPAHGRTVPLPDGRLLHVIEKGEGTPVVLIHGLPSNAGDWGDFPDRLAASGPYRVIAYDRVGYGYSTREASEDDGYTYTSNARELGELLDALGIDRAVLVGWSYGGAVAQHFAVLHPDRVSQLVLVASVSPSIHSDDASALGWVLASPFAESLLGWVASIPPLADAMMRSELSDAFAREDAIPDGWIEYTKAVLNLPGTYRAYALESQRGDPQSLRPEAIQVPTMVVQGADDYLVPYSDGEELHRRLPNSSFVPVLSGSHMLPVTHPDVLAEKIHDMVGAY